MSDLTPVQMFEAADVLERASKELADAYSPADYLWSAAGLRREAEVLLQEVL